MNQVTQKDVLEAVEGLVDDVNGKLDRRFNDIEDRIMNVEQKGAASVSISAYKQPENKGYRTFHAKGGPVYEIDAGTKVADVLNMPKADISFDRWLGAMVAGEKSQDKAALDFIREQKSVATTSTGVNVPTQFISGWIDNLRAASVLQRAGAVTVPMNDKTVQYARATGDPTASWHQEAGAISATDPTFVTASLTAKTIVCRTQVTLECMQDSPNFGQQLSSAMFGALGAEIDRAGLFGAGSGGEPEGIYGQSGVATVASVGTPTNYAEMISGLKALLDNNCRLDAIDKFAIMSPRTWATYQNLATGIASDNTPLERPQALRGMQFLPTTNVSDTLATSSPALDSAIFMGDFNQLIMGVRMDPSFKILELDTYASNLLYEVVAVARVDFMLARPASLCTLTGVAA